MTRLLLPKVTVSSRLDATTDEVWHAISSIEGVNIEMAPFMRMTPPGSDGLEAAATGKVYRLGLRGPLGIPMGDYPLQIKSFTLGVGFLEQTRIFPWILWQHERTIAEADGGTVVTDALSWKWRASRFDPLVGAGVRLFFNHRHRVLRRHHGG